MPAGSVQLIDENRDQANVDGFSKALVSIDTVHSRIHAGQVYQLDVLDLALADDAAIDVLIIVGADEGGHVRFAANAGGDAQIQLYEDTTVSANGAVQTPQNRNRRSLNTPDLTLYLGPTVTGVGTVLSNRLIPAGKGGNSAGGDISSFEEWILAESTNYLFRVTNRGGGAKPVGLAIDWYEAEGTI